MYERSDDRDCSKEYAWHIRDNDAPLAWFRSDAVHRPEDAIEESCERLPDDAWISCKIRRDLRDVRDVHDDRKDRSDVSDDPDDPIGLADLYRIVLFPLFVRYALHHHENTPFIATRTISYVPVVPFVKKERALFPRLVPLPLSPTCSWS